MPNVTQRTVQHEPTSDQIKKLVEVVSKLMRGDCVKVELTYRKANRAIRIQETVAREH